MNGTLIVESGVGFLEASQTDAILGGFITGLSASILAVCDSFVAIMLHKLRPLDEHFGLLYNCCVFMECFNLCISVFWSAPVIMSLNNDLGVSWIGRRIGQLYVYNWNVIVFITIAIAANRYAALTNPLQYRSKFTRQRALYILLAVAVVAFLVCSPYFIPGCAFYADPYRLGWVYGLEDCGMFLWWHCAVACSFAFAVLLFINLLAFKSMKQIKESIESVKFSSHAGLFTLSVNANPKPVNISKANALERNKQKQREIRFFLQAVANTVCFEGMIISFHLVSPLVPTAWGYFLLANYLLLLSHGTNGFLMVMINTEFRKDLYRWIKNLFARKTSVVVVVR